MIDWRISLQRSLSSEEIGPGLPPACKRRQHGDVDHFHGVEIEADLGEAGPDGVIIGTAQRDLAHELGELRAHLACQHPAATLELQQIFGDLQPWFSLPIRFAFGTRTSLKNTSLNS